MSSAFVLTDRKNLRVLQRTICRLFGQSDIIDCFPLLEGVRFYFAFDFKNILNIPLPIKTNTLFYEEEDLCRSLLDKKKLFNYYNRWEREGGGAGRRGNRVLLILS